MGGYERVDRGNLPPPTHERWNERWDGISYAPDATTVYANLRGRARDVSLLVMMFPTRWKNQRQPNDYFAG